MRAGRFRLAEYTGDMHKIILTPSDAAPAGQRHTRDVGFVRPLPGGGFRARCTETGVIAVDDSRTMAAARVLPDDGFPELCVRCEVNEPTYDAAAFNGPRGPYPSDLDDVCEDCLPEALVDWSEG